MNKTPELRPCPFCGGPADFRDDGIEGYAYCTHCLSRTDSFYSWREKNWKRDAARDWNTRVYPKEVLRALDKQTPDLVMQLCNEWGGTDNM